MLQKILQTALVLALLSGSTLAVHAREKFDASRFEDAQAAGKAILIDVSAEWCPTCKKQRPIVDAVEKERSGLVVYEVDFDTAKDALVRFRAQSQSTLIVFKGAKEVGRSTGDTDPARIRALVAKGF